MQSIIEEIYLNKNGQSKRIEESEEYWDIHKEVEDVFEKLKLGLNDKQKAQLDELYSKMCKLGDAQSLTHYKEGFKSGLLLAAETFRN